MSSESYKKTLSFLTAAVTFASMTVGCSSNESGSSKAAASAETESPSDETAEQSTLNADPISYNNTSASDLFSERDLDPSYDTVTAEITLNGDSAKINGTGASSDDSVITITEEGVYRFTGSLSNGQIIVNAENAKVQLILDNASINCNDSAPIYVMNAKKTFITLADGSKNSVTDGESYIGLDESGEPDAAIFSKDSLTINGNGSLDITANYADGIHSKDDIVITGGNISVTAAANGIKGKDYVAAAGGNITINSGKDGVKSTNTTDTSLGFIYIEDEVFNVTSSEDGFQAETDFIAKGGEFNIVSGGGSVNSTKVHTDDFGGFGGGKGNFNDFDFRQFDGTPPQGNGNTVSSTGVTPLAYTSDSLEQISTKGIKSGNEVIISGGDFNIDSADDALHSNANLTISGAALSLDSGDDGLHADSIINITGGKTTVNSSYEGIEGAIINISGGTVEVNSSDDGFNASDGTSQGTMGSYSEGAEINISGGMIYINAEGDGLDSNGNMSISGGTVIVNGPVNGGNGALDGNSDIIVTGGLIIAAGSSQMAEAPAESSSQNSVSATFSQSFSGGTLITLADSSGNEILSFAPAKTFQNIVISSSEIKKDETYTFYTGGTSSADETYGLYEKGGYNNDGEENESFTAENVTSYIGSQGMTSGGMHGGGKHPDMQEGFGDGNPPEMPDGLEPPTGSDGQPEFPDNFTPPAGNDERPEMPDGGFKGDRDKQTSPDKNSAG